MALVHVTVVPSTVLDPLCEITSPGNVTATLKSVNIAAAIVESAPDSPLSSLPAMAKVYSPSSWTMVSVSDAPAMASSGALLASWTQPMKPSSL